MTTAQRRLLAAWLIDTKAGEVIRQAFERRDRDGRHLRPAGRDEQFQQTKGRCR